LDHIGQVSALRSGNRWQLSRSGRVVADVVPDERSAGMYRVKLPGQPLSDMANLTRARDAVVALAGRAVSRQTKMAA
jgi:antitoxin (DNA-binding transcriptional repressor) of toxin-antitoxin stability system